MLYSTILALHVIAGTLAFVGSLGLSVAAFRSRKEGVLSARYWRYQGYVQLLTVLLGVFGAVLYAMGGRPKVEWHLLYGGMALLVVFIERGLGRERGLREVLVKDYGRFNEIWVFFGLNLFLWAMIGRGVTTGLWGV